MRIIAGSVGGRRLKSLRSLRAPRGAATTTRPTADRVREAIFNLLVARGPIPERVLDLYAGTGALGLEALSRGAGQAVFVEQDDLACELVRENARALGFESQAQVVCRRALDWLRAADGRFGWIFLDPPYASAGRELGRAVTACARLLDDQGVVVAEHEWRVEPEVEKLALYDRRRYGQTAVSLFRAEATEATP